MANPKKSALKKGTLLVTSALPYANGDIHLGHLVEIVQTDIYVRYQKMTGRRTVYVCADDTHGTPIQLSAQKRGITCEELIAEAWKNHVVDYEGFSIDFDKYYTTNSPENKKWAEYIFAKLKEQDLVVEKEIEQYFCEQCARFLPDRFISGTCPKCDAKEQYGDVCESCGATYDPTDLKDPQCITCTSKPVLKTSKHFFVQLAKYEKFLREYLTKNDVLQDDMRNFVMRWVDDGLKEWCISRDGPYFGFKIPGTENKYFYVWLDAPIGYIAATDKWCQENNEDIDAIWQSTGPGEVVHFIGKDIVYFHTLFWPVKLHAASLKLPAKVFVHGFLTVQGEKMSKTRGTFILARDYREKVTHPFAREYLRFYYGSKLSNNTADIDLNIEEFCNRVNTMLVNNIGNLHHRTFVFLDRYFEGKLPDVAWDEDMAQTVEETAADIARCFENVEFKTIVEKIQALGSRGNKYYQDTKPWELIKTDKDAAAKVMVTCANLVKACSVFLKPFVPNLVTAIETQYQKKFAWDDFRFSLRGVSMGKTEKLVKPLEESDFDALLGKSAVPTAKEKSPKGEQNIIDIADFQKIDLRVGTITKADRIDKSDKLIKLSVDTGSETRQIVGGIGKAYTPQELVGRQIVFVANLKPAKLMGVTSQGMLLAATKGKKMALVTPDADIPSGTPVS